MASAAEPADHQAAAPVEAPPAPPRRLYKHALSTRLWHWVNAFTIFIMIGSGLGILNAHPHLYWGVHGAQPDVPWLELPHWPSWMTIPGSYNLSLSRRWHLFFALVLGFGLLAFMIASLLNRHFQKQLTIRTHEIAPGHLWHDIKEHLALRFHDPANPTAFNVLQKIAYAFTLFVLLPVIILTGLGMSPGINAAWPWILELFGGRASARSIHFLAMCGIIGFVVVHLALVILAGPVREVGSMITGYWRVPDHGHEESEA
ncbi:cytochrome b/b6 domain-containing protein [Sphingomonas sp.]|uniref:cytochrome b/b6 domain-containing protein n=1 Tax=Sphingomonas sp. TaxID=28214 RepID=UPI001D36D49A|nr:cytochrome b/b6 domain-containing protein [Sphingomonas sp.]MBX9795422.1 cytochrome b/b6 domain-containing protein [Sphingomonas sp.]